MATLLKGLPILRLARLVHIASSTTDYSTVNPRSSSGLKQGATNTHQPSDFVLSMPRRAQECTQLRRREYHCKLSHKVIIN